MNAEHGSILVVDDTPANVAVLFDTLANAGFDVRVARNGVAALRQIVHEAPDLVLLDVMMPELDGYETCRRLRAVASTRHLPVIFMTALSDTADKVKGFEAGATDFVTKPFQAEEVLARVKTQLALRALQQDLEQEVAFRRAAETKLMEANADLEKRVDERTAELRTALADLEKLKNRLQNEVVYLRQEISTSHNFGEIVGQSPTLAETMTQVAQVAPTDSTVLVTGESGTGKELVARAVHQHSRRKAFPLIKVNCGAIAPNLVESELFGHEKGAFTGAMKQRQGRFELAHQGTLLLDEVGELPAETQIKLLRVLQEREFERVGGSETIRVDVRLIAATNRDLLKEVEAGRFRRDLYYRLNVFPVELPPLRERTGDIDLLAHHFVQLHARRLGKRLKQIEANALEALRAYPWPGNIREMQNVLERAAIVARGDTLRESDLALPSAEATGPMPDSLDQLEVMEREILQRALRRCRWQVGGRGGAADLLNRPASTIRDRIKKLGLERPV
ncbi:sigma-54-dependent transcriptional regulator [Synoicihabitans lomoniglobus]|uniref:Sigma 54-interacting transcriptional regulator n=1 Tax=Synoicihabitans lomoniglobus TaxID=2909285 RepID=A0AAF0CSG1_9BACT|nr:sigma 54-interacting transcriptional regulator [Opitutaceae bacterium LMO-M01]WED67235.1 sigma 54-interacting transcriptional regulator [Opitutaceae bacterium LMO-M01]